jgi:hypothetical protein
MGRHGPPMGRLYGLDSGAKQSRHVAGRMTGDNLVARRGVRPIGTKDLERDGSASLCLGEDIDVNSTP